MNDLTPDEDAIVLDLYIQVCEPAAPGTVSVPVKLAYAGEAAEDLGVVNLELKLTGAAPDTPVMQHIVS